MKVSNAKFTKRLSYVLLCVIISLFIIAIFTKITIYSFLIALLFVLFIYLFNILKTTTIELSGGCVTIKKNHPLTFNKFVLPFFELPYSRLLGYKITSKFGLCKLILKFNSRRKYRCLLKISLFGFTSMQKNKIKTSFGSILIPPDNDSSSINYVA